MWEKLLEEFSMYPRDICTVPKLQVEPKWFHVYVEHGNLYVERAKTHEPSSTIKHRLRLNSEELDGMKQLYDRRKAGEAISALATQQSWMSVYWYGIFSELGL